MSSFAVLRLKKRNLGSAAAMARHAFREDKTANADPSKRSENVVLVGPDSAEAVTAALRSSMPARRRQDAVEVIELLITASPEAIKSWPREEQMTYFRRSLVMLASRFGGADNIKSAVIHMDESTPHMQVLLVPLVDGKLVANKLIGGPAGLRQLQTDFAADVGAKHGLVRGIERKPGEARTDYQTVRRWYAAIAAAGSIDALPKLVKVERVEPLRDRPQPPGPVQSLVPGARERHEADLAAWRLERVKHARDLAAQQEAQAANKVTRGRLEELATLGLATYGSSARSVGERLAKAAETDKRVESGEQTLDKLRRQYTQGSDAISKQQEALAKIDKQLERKCELLRTGALEAHRDELVSEIRALEARRDQLRPS